MTNYNDLPDNCRVWIYQSDREFTPDEVSDIKVRLGDFVSNWGTHGTQLVAFADVYHNYFIAFVVDEESMKATGCSIDASVHLIQDLERELNLSLLTRTNFAYKDNGQIKVAAQDDFSELVKNGVVSDETIIFDNLVKNKHDFEEKWEIPFEKSWHKTLVTK
ncbi:MAG: ABC transporter ATPase [Bacteroidetes bacterium]|nr:ABC transporter ATPase [Bacteroidota bacterium]